MSLLSSPLVLSRVGAVGGGGEESGGRVPSVCVGCSLSKDSDEFVDNLRARLVKLHGER